MNGPREPRVVVLMSTYNGARHVAEQLDSILRQLPDAGRVIVRDDGSSDDTPALVQASGDARVTLVRGSNLGFGASFLTLLGLVPPEAEMVMFADQDDLWLPGKIMRAWQHLAPLGEVPALYGSAQMLADAKLRPLHATPRWPRGPSLAGALTENIITGCTAALNRPAVDLLRRAGVPASVHFHDWWLYLVVSAFGSVVFDEHPTLLYRQHGRNVIGHGRGWLGRQWGVIRFLLRNDWVALQQRQNAAFLHHYGDALAPDVRAWILRYFHGAQAGAAGRWRLVFSLRRWRQTLPSDIAFRVLLAAHKLRLWPPPWRQR